MGLFKDVRTLHKQAKDMTPPEHRGMLGGVRALKDTAAFARERVELGLVVRRGEHHGRGARSARDALGYHEAARVGEVQVEQDHVGRAAAGLDQGPGPVLRLADDRVPVGLEHPPGHRAEARVVVDDEDTHGTSVPAPGAGDTGGRLQRDLRLSAIAFLRPVPRRR